MKLKAPIIQIPDEDPFRHDLLRRKESAEILTELLRSTGDPLVLCVDASWGEGKTTFLTMWKKYLENTGFQTLYFNAWENDFSDDGLVSLIGELEAGIDELSLKDSKVKKAKSHLTKAKKMGAVLLKHALPAGVKIATAGAVNLDAATEATLSKLSEKIAQDQIENYEVSKKSVAGFRKELSLFAEQVTTNAEKGRKTPLVILIDELDRCRPTYAIEILEKAKHFFSVPNVVFVLAVDKEQLGHSIRSIYGLGMDVNGYLRRFIDLDYALPRPEKGAFCKAQFDRFGLREFFDKRKGYESRDDYNHFEKLFTELFSMLRCSLREQEHSFALLSLAIRTTPENYKLYPLLLGTLIVLKIKNPDLYKGFITGKTDPHSVLEYLRSQSGGRELLGTNYGAALEAHLITCRLPRYEIGDLVSPYQKAISNPEAPEMEKARANRIIELIQSFEFNDGYGILGYLVKKIDMASQFVH